MKNQYIGEGLPKKGAWTVCRFKGGRRGRVKKDGGLVFLRVGLIPPMDTM